MGLLARPIVINEDTQFDAKQYNGCVSYTIMNKGTANVLLYGTFPLNAGDAPLSITGELTEQRDDVFDIKFIGAGTKIVFIFLTIKSS